MDSGMWLVICLCAHALLCGACVFRLIRCKVPMNRMHLLWACALPFFGPIMGLLLTRQARAGAPDMIWMLRGDEYHHLKTGFRTRVEETVPLEEALLINDAKRRRALMLGVLRTDPMSYLDLLLTARFNEDTETAHYAASTIMELQRNLQMEIQQRQSEILSDGKNVAKRREHIHLLVRYCQSGLLEGQLLRRQRLMLAQALRDILLLEESDEWYALSIENHLALNESEEARNKAEYMLRQWPLNERSWLEALRVAVETSNQQDAKRLIEGMREQPIDWSKAGREQVAVWMEAPL